MEATELNGRMVSTQQSEINRFWGYQTLVFGQARKVYAKGFICFCKEFDFTSICGYNDLEEFAIELNLSDAEMYDMDAMSIGDTFTAGESKFMRIW